MMYSQNFAPTHEFHFLVCLPQNSARDLIRHFLTGKRFYSAICHNISVEQFPKKIIYDDGLTLIWKKFSSTELLPRHRKQYKFLENFLNIL